MFTAALVRAQVALTFLFAKMAPQRPASRYRVGLVGARGITMIEYAIMAAIALAIGLIFKNQLTAAFTSILSAINKALGSGGFSK